MANETVSEGLDAAHIKRHGLRLQATAKREFKYWGDLVRIIELIKRKRNAGCVRILCGAVKYSLLASATLGASQLAAQSCNGGVCPTINVIGQLPASGGNPTGGLGFLGRMDSSGWEWMNDSGGSIEQPPAIVLCPAVQAAWDEKQCAGVSVASVPDGCGSGLL